MHRKTRKKEKKNTEKAGHMENTKQVGRGKTRAALSQSLYTERIS